MNNAVKILVTGASGQLGSELQAISSQYEEGIFFFATRKELPIEDEEKVRSFFAEFKPQYCINCAAYTAVDKAEDPSAFETAKRVNTTAVGILAKACNDIGSKFIHISTDYVFDGAATIPYKPQDITNPIGVYGSTKLEGEQLALANTDAVIIRTAWVYSSFGKNFVKTMIRLMNEKPLIKVVSDQYGSPTYAADLAAAIMQIIDSQKWIPGVYHYSNKGVINWFEFALAIKELIHSNCEVHAISTAEYPTPAKRPAYSVLDTSELIDTYEITIPDWKDSLKKCISKLS